MRRIGLYSYPRILLLVGALMQALLAFSQSEIAPLILDDASFKSINIYNRLGAFEGTVAHKDDLLKLHDADLRQWHDAAYKSLPDTLWLKGTLIRADPSLSSVLISACEQVHSTECYVVKDGHLELVGVDSVTRPIRERTYPGRSSYFQVNFDSDTIQFFFRSTIPVSALKEHYYHVNVYNVQGYVFRMLGRIGLQSFYAGLLAVAILIALFMAFQFKEGLMVRYALFIFSMGMYFVVQQGLSVVIPLLTYRTDIINQNLFISFIFLSGCAFLVKQLSLKSRQKGLYWTFVIYTLIAALYASVYRHIPYFAEGYSLFNILSLGYVMLMLFVVIQAAVAKVENSRSTLISLSLALSGAIIFILGLMKVIPTTRFAQQSFQLGVVGFALSLLYGLFLRIREMEMSKAVAIVGKQKSDELLFNVLPEDVANELKASGRSEAQSISEVSILFTDFKGFTQLSEKMSPEALVDELHHCFVAFDQIISKYNLEKIKTIGDSYMAAGGLSKLEDAAGRTVLAALEMASFISERYRTHMELGLEKFRMRIGIHTGKVVAGIVGVKKFQYDIWGDAVNTASRMESHGEVDMVNISQATYELIKDDPRFAFESRGSFEVKGKGEVQMYFVSRA